MDTVPAVAASYPKLFAVICGECDHINPLATDYRTTGYVFLVCHECELPIRAEITQLDLMKKLGAEEWLNRT